MRNDLLHQLCMIFQKYDAMNEQTKAELTILLSDYEIEKRETDIILYDPDDYNLEMLQRFLIAKRVAGLTENSLIHYKYQLEQIFGKINKPINMITADDLMLYLAIRQAKDKKSDATLVNEWHALSSFFGWMHKEEFLERNPMFRVECPKKRKKKKKAFSSMECEMLRNACIDAREKLLIELLLSTWCRISEIEQMDITDIEGDSITVIGKGQKERIVYLNSKAQLAIKEYLSTRKDNEPALITGRTGRMQKGGLEKMVKQIGERAGIENVHPHRFRRTGATFALRAGMPIEKVSFLLGHEAVSTTQIYLDINEEEMKQAHKKWVS